MKIKCNHCDNDKEFITQPNRYEIYCVVNDELQYQTEETTHEALRLYCRECSEQLEVDIILNK